MLNLNFYALLMKQKITHNLEIYEELKEQNSEDSARAGDMKTFTMILIFNHRNDKKKKLN